MFNLYTLLGIMYSPTCFQVDKHIRKLDSDLARFEAEIQDKAISATRNVEENSQKRKLHVMVYLCLVSIIFVFTGGRKKIKDKENKKKSASSEEETITKTSKKKPLKKGMYVYCSYK